MAELLRKCDCTLASEGVAGALQCACGLRGTSSPFAASRSTLGAETSFGVGATAAEAASTAAAAAVGKCLKEPYRTQLQNKNHMHVREAVYKQGTVVSRETYDKLKAAFEACEVAAKKAE
ncbi:ATP synthase epsilon [Cyclospora cayetanensis]|uniref:ATP synthase epsilon n=1 Tax=Cyclospora cayetanensis TaxID=88456 RepID=A0A1D3D2Q1_9EIME|nr:ATP synthase epsilon [Cyclospora cayetanensis]